ncbi:hypothetical protein nvc1_117 [Namao virus]|nr:hypothetical protein nvc1_117 [Namao virus]
MSILVTCVITALLTFSSAKSESRVSVKCNVYDKNANVGILLISNVSMNSPIDYRCEMKSLNREFSIQDCYILSYLDELVCTTDMLFLLSMLLTAANTNNNLVKRSKAYMVYIVLIVVVWGICLWQNSDLNSFEQVVLLCMTVNLWNIIWDQVDVVRRNPDIKVIV